MKPLKKTIVELEGDVLNAVDTILHQVAAKSFDDAARTAKDIRELLRIMQAKKEWGERQRSNPQSGSSSSLPPRPRRGRVDPSQVVPFGNGRYDSNMIIGDEFGENPMDGYPSWEDSF